MKFKLRTLAILIFVMMIATVASAGIMDTIKEFAAGQALTVLMTAGLSILGTFGAVYVLWGKAGIQFYQFAKSVLNAVDPDGPEGRKVNGAEMERIVKRAQTLYPAVAQAIAATKKRRGGSR